MRRRPWVTAVSAVALLVVSVPVSAQDASSRVSFDGLGFSFDRSLGRSVNVTTTPAIKVRPQQVDESEPAHVVFSVYGRQRESAKVPTAWDVPGAVRFYHPDALQGYPIASAQLTQLQKLLSERPDLATTTAPSENGSNMPFMPVGEAGQAIIARPEYIDTPTMSGVAYLTVFRQDVSPFARGDFWYTFQGLSNDGQWYVAVDWVLNASMFPKSLSPKDYEKVGKNAASYMRYLRQSLATLNAADPSAFTPTLTSLDALVRSITFTDATTTAPSPAPSVAPSVPSAPSIAPLASATPPSVPASAAP